MQTGTVIDDRFVIEHLAGEGGMGAVYRALDRASGQPVALKVLLGLRANETERFQRETRILANLTHPSIVRYVASGESDGRPWLAMEWLEGEDLDQRIDRGPLAPAESALVVRKAADALGVAHRRGVVHRDVKPSNLFVPGGDLSDVRVLDFGIARVGTSTRGYTRTGAVMGSPGYISPEQARGARNVDARADVFALGCVLFACLTGRPPFVAEDLLGLFAKLLLEDTPRVRDLWPEVPPAIDALCARLMSAAPENRPRDGAEVAREIEALGALPSARPEGAPRAATIGNAERRLVCAILVDARMPAAARTTSPDVGNSVGFAMAEEDPDGEDRAALAAVAKRHRGRIEILPGGARMAILEGGGDAATDLAARAARCALAMHEEAGRRRVGLVTGRAATTHSGTDGDLIDRATRLLRASGGDVRIDEATQGLLGDRFDLVRIDEGWELLRERGSTDSARCVLGKPTPCVGREREIATLSALFEECAAEPVARAALILGDAGVGKSRVRQEVVRRIKQREGGATVWIARGDAIGAGAPLAMLGMAIRDAAGISGAEPIEERRAKLVARVAERVRPTDADRVAQFLGEIVGAPFPSSASVGLAAAREDPVLLGDQMCRAFEDLVAAECATRPVVLVLEDLHWGDLPTVKIVDATLRNMTEAPLFVLATARPEVAERFPSLWAARSLLELRVGALTPKASERLVRSVLGEPADRALVERIVARGGGHALHLEEIVRAVAEGGGEELPSTVIAMVQARLELLEPEARRLLRAASVFGRTFWTSGVAALTSGATPSDETLRWLRELHDREWIDRVAASRFTGEDELVFRQDVVREAAYATLTDADRTLGHRLAGAWLEAAGEASGVVLARHFEIGGDASRAIGAFANAAAQSLDGNDFRAAIDHAERAIALGASDAVRGEVSAIAAEAHAHLGAFEEARANGTRAMDLLDRDDPAWLKAAGAAILGAGKLGDGAGVERAALALSTASDACAAGSLFAQAASNAVIQLYIANKTALADAMFDRIAAAASRDPAVVAQVRRADAIRALFAGDEARTAALLRESAASFEAAGDLRNACSVKKTQGYYACECGAIEEGERTLRESLALAERLGLLGVVTHAKHDLGSPLIRLGKLDEAERLQREALVNLTASGDRRIASYARGFLSWIHRLRGEHAAAESEARLAVETAPSAIVAVGAHAQLAAARFAAGDTSRALAASRDGLAALAEVGSGEDGVTLLRLTHAKALAATGREDEAYAAILTTREAVLARAARIADVELRSAFLDRIIENAETLALADAWASSSEGRLTRLE